MSVLCTICARAGSKGVPGKNIKEVAGMPLIAHTIKQALACASINRVVVSTDSQRIASVAKECGAEVPFIRPADLAGDHSAKLPAIKHAVNYYIRELNYKPDLVIDMDPTSPLRLNEDIERCLSKVLEDPECDSVITGYRSNKNPYFNMVEIGPGGIAYLSKKLENPVARRQDAPVVFCMNASIYVWKTACLLAQDQVVSGRVKFVEMPEDRSIDIDNETDLHLVEILLNKRRQL
jgi:CMP-N,N'-diacetyllegionaminic acid synthase